MQWDKIFLEIFAKTIYDWRQNMAHECALCPNLQKFVQKWVHQDKAKLIAPNGQKSFKLVKMDQFEDNCVI